MKQHMREYFVSTARAGFIGLSVRGVNLRVYTPTVEQELEGCVVFSKKFDEYFSEGIMTDDQMLVWMREKGIWSDEDDAAIEGLKKDLNKLRVEIYKARNNEVLRERIRLYIRAGEKQMQTLLAKRYSSYDRSCEGMATWEKEGWHITNCTFTTDNKPYDFNESSVQSVVSAYKGGILNEQQIRDLSRNEPWKSLWSVREKFDCKLFNNNGRELHPNQKGLLIWSSVYDSIQESIDCPNEDVIEDDDMLDGWFVHQAERRKKEKAEMEFESTSNDKIRNADEVFIMANTQNDRERIEGLNHVHGKMVKKEREALLLHKHNNADGTTGQGEFRDEKLKMTTAHNQMYKGKFGG